MTGLLVMFIMAVVAVPVALRYSGPFRFRREVSAAPVNTSFDPATMVSTEDGSQVSLGTLAKICALVMGVGLLWLFLYLIFVLTAETGVAVS